MLNVFTLANGRLFQEEIESLEELARFKPIWVDLEDPTPEERRWVKQHFGLSIPEDAMDEDIEESARFFEEDNGELHVRSDFLIDDEENPRAVRVAFILNEHNDQLKSRGVLFSIHDEDVPVFRLLRMRARRMPGLIENAKDVLLMLFDADAEYCADTLEDIYDDLEQVSRQVLAGNVTDNKAGEVLSAIAEIASRTKAAGRLAGIHTGSPAMIARSFAQGYDFASLLTDARMFTSAVSSQLAAGCIDVFATAAAHIDDEVQGF